MSDKLTNIEELKNIRRETEAKWNSLGFLDGIKGHLKESIAELYQCCKSTIINKQDMKKKLDAH